MTKITWPAAERNKGPMLEVLRRKLPATCRVLEIASGPGQHAATFTAACPGWDWQPSDPKPEHRDSIRAWRDEVGAPNLRDPIDLDVTAPWPVAGVDAILASNLIHASPWPVTLALFAGSRRALVPGGLLVVYGAFLRGPHTVPSNLAFCEDLRSRDPSWGVRELDDVLAAARDAGLELDEIVEMPSNNLMIAWRNPSAVR